MGQVIGSRDWAARDNTRVTCPGRRPRAESRAPDVGLGSALEREPLESDGQCCRDLGTPGQRDPGSY